jgi:hypothetical protein
MGREVESLTIAVLMVKAEHGKNELNFRENFLALE